MEIVGCKFSLWARVRSVGALNAAYRNIRRLRIASTSLRRPISGQFMALENQTGHILLALGQTIGGHQQRGNSGRVGELDDHRHAPRPCRHQCGAVQYHPPATARQHTCDGNLARHIGVRSATQRA